MDRMIKYGWLALIAAPFLISATSDSDLSDDTVLSVSGVGYATAQGAETFTVRAGSRTFSTYPARAMRDNAGVLEELREQLADKGIDKRDISTSNFEFRPGRDPNDNDDPAQGYIASQQLVVFVRNPDQAGAVIEALVEAGATDVSVQNFRGWWGNDRLPPAVESAARKQAVADARKKADDYAAALGMRISRVVSVNDGGVRITGEPAPEARAVAIESGTRIDNGESAVVASVNMQFELAPK
jgi:uncharacterized protein YggE